MTGYGRSVGYSNGFSIVLDLRSVNHKFYEVSMKLPKGFLPLEDRLKGILRKRFARGRFDLSVFVNGGVDCIRREIHLDQKLAKRYYGLLLDLKKSLKMPGEIDVVSLLTLRDVVVLTESPPDLSLFERPLLRLLKRVMVLLETMRRREGRVLAAALRGLLRSIRMRLHRVEKRVPRLVLEHRFRLTEKIRQLSGGVSLDPARLSQEVAYFAERSDIEEELIRLKSHCRQFDIFLRSNEPVGRSLDFLIQEMHREVNTLGSKANDSEITMEVVGMKGELERLREQVQNVE